MSVVFVYIIDLVIYHNPVKKNGYLIIVPLCYKFLSVFFLIYIIIFDQLFYFTVEAWWVRSLSGLTSTTASSEHTVDNKYE